MNARAPGEDPGALSYAAIRRAGMPKKMDEANENKKEERESEGQERTKKTEERVNVREEKRLKNILVNAP